eukprot:scaffold1605_cov242-Pinguiococcus_pyrenoidosus.AAC.8
MSMYTKGYQGAKKDSENFSHRSADAQCKRRESGPMSLWCGSEVTNEREQRTWGGTSAQYQDPRGGATSRLFFWSGRQSLSVGRLNLEDPRTLDPSCGDKFLDGEACCAFTRVVQVAVA